VRRALIFVSLLAGLLWPNPSQAHGSCTLTAFPPRYGLGGTDGLGKAAVAIGRLVCTEPHRITITTALHRKVNGMWTMVDHTTETWANRVRGGATGAGEMCRLGKLYRTVTSATAGRVGAHPLGTKYSRGVRVC
jgi:hypothetical protein